MADFLIGRNPNPNSKLPYVLCVPVQGAEAVWLLAKEAWPNRTRVFCYPVAEPQCFEILERLEVRSCVRRGPAIDLLLSRGINKRCQFVYTHYKKHQRVFWQTAKTAKAARPGVRIPPAASLESATYYVDSRERYGYTFSSHRVRSERKVLRVGDYAAVSNGEVIGVVERKSLDDFANSISDGSLGLEMMELAAERRAAIAIEGEYSDLLRHAHTHPGFLIELVARLQVRYPHVPMAFVGTKKLGEEWTFRYLKAVYQEWGCPQLSNCLQLSNEPLSINPVE